MNIFDCAMGIEQEGEALYRGFAKSASDKGRITIFTELADQEKRHYDIFKKMKENQAANMSETSFLDNVKSIFADWKHNKDNFGLNVSQADLYQKALDMEKKSIDFYMDKSKEVDNVNQKALFEKIAKEEQSHYEVIENIIAFIIKPETWVENAEFTKIGTEY